MDLLDPVLYGTILGKPGWAWLAFLAVVAALLALDLGVLHRKSREIGIRESLAMSAFYIAVALGFGAVVWQWQGPTAGIEYLTGFAVEKTLAMDNIFVNGLSIAAGLASSSAPWP